MKRVNLLSLACSPSKENDIQFFCFSLDLLLTALKSIAELPDHRIAELFDELSASVSIGTVSATSAFGILSKERTRKFYRHNMLLRPKIYFSHMQIHLFTAWERRAMQLWSEPCSTSSPDVTGDVTFGSMDKTTFCASIASTRCSPALPRLRMEHSGHLRLGQTNASSDSLRPRTRDLFVDGLSLRATSMTGTLELTERKQRVGQS